MNDFFNDFWPLLITAVTLIGILACYLLLHFNSKVKKSSSSDNSTGHIWDENIREMNNPLPKWWMGLFIITIIFGLVYLWLYPGLPVHEGSLKWSQNKQYLEEVEASKNKIQSIYSVYASTNHKDLAKDPKAMKIGKSLFLNNCAQGHGSDAKGSIGFPNLTDDDWLYGGSIGDIVTTIKNGRKGVMPPMGNIGSDKEIEQLAHYVQGLSGAIHNSGLAQLGKVRFGSCAACHGADGKGNQKIGAPNLTDDIWLHGVGINAIKKRIYEGKVNEMPEWSSRLTDEQIHILSSYVWSFSNDN